MWRLSPSAPRARLGATPASGVSSVATVGYAGFLLGPPIIGFLSGATDLRWALASLLLATLVVVAGGLSGGGWPPQPHIEGSSAAVTEGRLPRSR